MKHLAFWKDEAPLRVRSAWVRWWPWAQIRQLRSELFHYRRWLDEAEEAEARLKEGTTT
jgi:hypothetical protein